MRSMIQMGKLIHQLRKQQNLTQEALGGTLISKSELSRIENGQKEPDVFVLNALMCRLGESLEHFEIVVTGTEHELLRLRSLIEKSMQAKEFAEAERKLQRYEELIEHRKQLHSDYIAEIRQAIKAKQQKVELSVCELPKTTISAIDLLKDIRKAKGWSQEQFSGDVCARETISCIENGRTPNHKMLLKLMEKHDIVWKNYYGYVETEDFKIYRMVREYQSLVREDKESAGRLLEEIRAGLDCSNPVNRQFLEGSRILERLADNTGNMRELLQELAVCLHYTMPEYDGKLYRIPYREEVVLLQGCVECMKRLGNVTAAEVLEQNLTKKLGKKLKVS